MVAIRGGTVVTVTGETLERGTVLVEGGKITAVGAEVEVPSGAEVLDATGKWVTPGLIDVHSHISTLNEPRDSHSHVDGNERTHPITPHLRALDALNPHDMALREAREAGFTTCYTLPGSANLIGGTGIAFKLRPGKTVFDIVIPGTEMMKMALGQNPINMHQNNKEYPTTRMGSGARLRETLANARQYLEKKEKGDDCFDFRLEALLPLLKGEMKARIHCHRADDIVTAMRIAQEFGFPYVLEHASEGWKITEYLKENGATCVVGPLLTGPYKMEIWERYLTTPGVLAAAGIPVCLTADAASETKWLPVHVGMAMARGLSEEAAFRSVTMEPARVMGLEGRIGSIEAGKDADIAVFSGHPFCNWSLCEATMIDGQWVHRQ